MKPLITKDTLSGVSDPFNLNTQVTVGVLGLEPGDTVTLWIVLLSEVVRNFCACPPFPVQLPSVIDEVQLMCCGTPIELSRDNPFVVLDAPQGFKIRAKLVQLVPEPISTQFVFYVDGTTTVINDRLRGCPCEVTP